MSQISVDKQKTELLGYPELYVMESPDNSDDVFEVYAKPRWDFAICPKCKSDRTQQRGTQTRTILDCVNDNGNVRIVTLHYHVRQFYCLEGSHSFSESVYCFSPRQMISNRLTRYIQFLTWCDVSLTSIASTLHVSFDTVYNKLRERMSRLRVMAPRFHSTSHVFLKQISANDRTWTIIGNLDAFSIAFFSSDDIKTIVKDCQVPRIKAYYNWPEFFMDASMVVVDPDFEFGSELKSVLPENCVIAVDQFELYSRLLAAYERVAKKTLSGYRARKLLEYTSSGYTILDQKEFNFLNRAFSESEELRAYFSAVNGLRCQLNMSYIDSAPVMNEEELAVFFVENKYVSKDLSSFLFMNNTLHDSSIDAFREIVELFTTELMAIKKNQRPWMVEDRLFYSIPSTAFLNKDCESTRTERSVFVNNANRRGEYDYIGKTYNCIKETFAYRKGYISGSIPYNGPEIISESW